MDAKSKRVRQGAFAKGKKPLFVQMILDNIWSIYDAVLVQKDRNKSTKIVNALNLNIAARDVKHQDPKIYLQAIFQQWLPLAGAVLTAVCDKLPSPKEIGSDRAKCLMFSQWGDDLEALPKETVSLLSDVIECSSDASRPTVAFVSKIFAVETKLMPSNRPKQQSLSADELRERKKQIIENQVEKQVRFDQNVSNSRKTVKKESRK